MAVPQDGQARAARGISRLTNKASTAGNNHNRFITIPRPPLF
jgi:hypothetical protein